MTRIMVHTPSCGDWRESTVEAEADKIAAGTVVRRPELDGEYDDGLPTYFEYTEEI